MAEWKKILPKALLLLLLLAGMNLLYKRFFLPADLAAYSESARLVAAVQDTSDILYLGESSNFSVADADLDKLSISQFLAQYYPGLRLGTISKGALHAGNYYDMLRSIPADAPVKTVVVTLNLRSFDASWINSKLETALQKEMIFLKPGPVLWRRLMLSLRNYEIKSEKERHEDVLERWGKDTLHFPFPFPYPNVLQWDSAVARRIDRIREDFRVLPGDSAKEWDQPRKDTLPQRTWEETALAAHYVKTFAFQIDTATNPRIRDFDRIVKLARDRGWNLVFNLLPENTEQAELLVGPPITFLIRQNRDILHKRYGHLPQVILVDQLDSLPSAEFRDQDWTTEHYMEYGRRLVARGLAQALRTFHPDEFVERLSILHMNTGIFLNDCEGKMIWGQMQTLDGYRAHNGKSSCMTGPAKGQFGITFTAPVPKMDTTRLDTLDFRCWVYQESRDHNGAIAWEAGGEKSGYLWDSLQLHGLTEGEGMWQEVHFKVPLWPNVTQADIIKVYPYNPSQEAIWFDDIRIEFN